MVKDPRSDKPGSSEPEGALDDLLRALARKGQPSPGAPEPPPAQGGDEKLDALRALAERLDLQLRGAGPARPAPGPSPYAPGPPPPGPMPQGPFPPGPSPTLPPPSFSPAPPPASPLPPTGMAQAPPRPARQARFGPALQREWRALVAALPEAHALVPRFSPARYAFIGIAVGVLVIAAIGGIVGVRGPRTTQGPSDQIVPPVGPSATAPTRPSVETAPATDLAAVTKAMSDCDAEATKDPNSLHFLVLPMVPQKGAENDWRSLALQEVGNTFLLLSAK